MPISLISKLHSTPLAFLDVETTGASAEFGDRVIEIGIARVENAQLIAQFDQLIDPTRRISPGVVALTGITNDMVAGQPTFDELLPRIAELLKDCVIIGHNIRFDLSFLHCEFRRARVPFIETFGPTHVLDTLRIARRRFGRGGNGLQILSRRLGITPPAAHRALADSLTTHQVFQALVEPLGGFNCDLCDVIADQGGPMGLLPASPREPLLPLELIEALEQHGLVQMDYIDGRDNRTQRIIKPLDIRRRKGELVLVAHCHLRNDRRTFKLERIVHLNRIDSATPDPATCARVLGIT